VSEIENPKSLLEHLKKIATEIFPLPALNNDDENFHKQLLAVKSQMLLEYEMTLNGKPGASIQQPYANMVRSILYFINRKAIWDTRILRQYLDISHPSHTIEDREACIRVFQSVRDNPIHLCSRAFEIPLEARYYHWNDRYRKQCVNKAIAWILEKISHERRWDKKIQQELDYYLGRTFPDIPATEKECLIQLLSLSFHKGVIKFPRVSSCLPFRKTKLARIKAKKGWTVDDFVKRMIKK